MVHVCVCVIIITPDYIEDLLQVVSAGYAQKT